MSAARLILIPTPLEAGLVECQLAQLAQAGCCVQLCGFGPIVAAARCMQAIAQAQPSEVVLLGIAGGLSDELQVGSAVEFSEVVCYGVGVGSHAGYRSASSLGWAQWSNVQVRGIEPTTRNSSEIQDELRLTGAGPRATGLLLSCCAASADTQDVKVRRAAHPQALAEDMEGFAVAAACQLSQIPVRIIRGISNRAGQRNPADWKIEAAMQAAAELCLSSLGPPRTDAADE